MPHARRKLKEAGGAVLEAALLLSLDDDKGLRRILGRNPQRAVRVLFLYDICIRASILAPWQATRTGE